MSVRVPVAPDTMPCRRCGGCGRVDLPEELQATLDVVRAGPITARMLSKAMRGRSSTAANNRLEDLRALGFVTRAQYDGKAWLYTASDSRSLTHDFGACAWERNGVAGVCRKSATIRYRDGRKTLLVVCEKHDGWARRQLGISDGAARRKRDANVSRTIILSSARGAS